MTFLCDDYFRKETNFELNNPVKQNVKSVIGTRGGVFNFGNHLQTRINQKQMEHKKDNDIPGKKTNERFLGGLFDDRVGAESAYNHLKSMGYRENEIHLAMSGESREKFYPENTDLEAPGTRMVEGIGDGTEVGALVGIVAAVATSFIVPGIGFLVGPLAAGLIGATAGGLAGGFIGGLVEYGLPETQARQYEEGIKSGKIFLGVHPKNGEDANQIEQTWKSLNGQEIYF